MTKFVQIDKGRDNMIKNFINRMLFIKKAFQTTKDEMLISLGIILVLTGILSVVFYIVESIAQPDVYRNYWDALVWAYTRYIEGGDGVFDGAPTTAVGKIVASLIGTIGIAIVAIPAGLIGSGFMDAIAEEKREKELADMRHRMLKQFPRFSSAAFNNYCKALPDGCPDEYRNARFTTRAQLLSRFQTRLGIDFKDIADICTKYPEFCLRDMADEISDEQNPISTFIVELLPYNTEYGCFINRGSRVTIMVTNGSEELGTSWFGYHIALLGGFNFICKNQDVAADDRDSYYTMTNEVLVENRDRAYYLTDKKQLKQQLSLLDEKSRIRDLFFSDLHAVSGSDKCVINLQSAIKSSRNKIDIHFIYNNRERNNPSVNDITTIESIITQINEAFSRPPFDDGTTYIAQQSDAYALTKNNIAYKIRSTTELENTNIFHIRVASNLINTDLRRSVLMYIIADLLHQTFAQDERLREVDIHELRNKGYGYSLS